MESIVEAATLEGLFMPVVLTLPRLTAAFAVIPFLSGSLLTGTVRSSLLLTLALFMSPMAGDVGVAGNFSLGWMLLVAAKEALIGTMLGLSFGVFIWAAQSVGELIDFETGSGNAAFFDPVAGHDSGPTGTFLGWLAITLFVTGGGLLAMLGVLVDSYRLWPVVSFFPKLGAVLQEFVVRQGDTLFTWIVKLAAPVLFVLILVDLGLGLVGRVAPRLNIFVFAQPLKSALAILILALGMPFIYESLQTFLRPENGVLQFLRSTL